MSASRSSRRVQVGSMPIVRPRRNVAPDGFYQEVETPPKKENKRGAVKNETGNKSTRDQSSTRSPGRQTRNSHKMFEDVQMEIDENKTPAKKSLRHFHNEETPATKLARSFGSNMQIADKSPARSTRSSKMLFEPISKSGMKARIVRVASTPGGRAPRKLDIDENVDMSDDENTPPPDYVEPPRSSRSRGAALMDVFIPTATRSTRSSSRGRPVAVTAVVHRSSSGSSTGSRSSSRIRERNEKQLERKRLENSHTPRKVVVQLTVEPVRLKRVDQNTCRVAGPNSPWTGANKTTKSTKKVLEILDNDDDYSDEDSEEEEMSEEEEAAHVTPSRRRGASNARTPAVVRKAQFASPSPTKKARCNGANAPRTAARKAETLEVVRRRLHTAEVPERMPCREEEAARIEHFIRHAAGKDGTSQALYISGVPGTGKTATVHAVMKRLAHDHTVPHFIYVYVNAMELVDPKHIYVNILHEVEGHKKRVSPLAARRKLSTMFEMTDRKRPAIIIMVDELDQLCTKKQEVIYELFNWTSVESARVSVMAIANTLDLPERMLSQRITSRLGSNRICFQPYDFHQIEEIINDRLAGSQAVSGDAVQFASRKVASISGDLRKALDILRRAVEIALEQGSKALHVQHVTAANKEAASTVRVEMVKALSTHARTLFRAALTQTQSSGVEEMCWWELVQQYQVLCRSLVDTEPLGEAQCGRLLMGLCSARLLATTKMSAHRGGNTMMRKVRLGMTPQEAQFALKQADDACKV